MMNELKLCPFCGGEAEYHQFANPRHFYLIKCVKCNCGTDGFKLNRNDNTATQNKAANAVAWNTRTDNWKPVSEPLTSGDEVIAFLGLGSYELLTFYTKGTELYDETVPEQRYAESDGFYFTELRDGKVRESRHADMITHYMLLPDEPEVNNA